MSEGALSGLLVVALEQVVAAPLCTVRMEDKGARVIKIKRPEGETARHHVAAVKGTSAYFAWLNRRKERAVLDLKAPQDMALFQRILAQADALVQNLIPGAMARMGLSDEDLARDLPEFIAVSIVGYGQDTQSAAMRAYDMLAQAESGICAVTGSPEVPSKIGVPAADIATGMNAHAAFLVALTARGRSRRGAQIEIAMFDSMADWMAVPLLHYEHSGRQSARFGLSHAAIYPYPPFNRADGTVIVAVQNICEWLRFCAGVLRRPDLIAHPDYTTNALRVASREALDLQMEPMLIGLTTVEAIARLEAVSIAWGRYTAVRDLGAHPALRRTDVTLPYGQSITLPRPAGRNLSFRPGPVPALGSSSVSLRAEFGATPRT